MASENRASSALAWATAASMPICTSFTRCCSLSTAIVRISNSSRSFATLSRPRSKRSLQYNRKAESPSRTSFTLSVKPFKTRLAAAMSAPFRSKAFLMSLTSMSKRLVRAPTCCSWSRRSSSQVASSARKASICARKDSRPSVCRLTSVTSTTRVSAVAFTCFSRPSICFCNWMVGSMSSKTWRLSRFSISAASTRRSEERFVLSLMASSSSPLDFVVTPRSKPRGVGSELPIGMAPAPAASGRAA
mmetsp:Transcript_118436/g.340071  ORF Transcript_118436/g.340071 Transcript_118436/m.340071 type:complete len:246 (+) Transcript_118436:1014-1751(+)